MCFYTVNGDLILPSFILSNARSITFVAISKPDLKISSTNSLDSTDNLFSISVKYLKKFKTINMHIYTESND